MLRCFRKFLSTKNDTRRRKSGDADRTTEETNSTAITNRGVSTRKRHSTRYSHSLFAFLRALLFSIVVRFPLLARLRAIALEAEPLAIRHLGQIQAPEVERSFALMSITRDRQNSQPSLPSRDLNPNENSYGNAPFHTRASLPCRHSRACRKRHTRPGRPSRRDTSAALPTPLGSCD